MMDHEERASECWCGTCRDFQALLEAATKQIERMSPEEQAEFKRMISKTGPKEGQHGNR